MDPTSTEDAVGSSGATTPSNNRRSRSRTTFVARTPSSTNVRSGVATDDTDAAIVGKRGSEGPGSFRDDDDGRAQSGRVGSLAVRSIGAAASSAQMSPRTSESTRSRSRTVMFSPRSSVGGGRLSPPGTPRSGAVAASPSLPAPVAVSTASSLRSARLRKQKKKKEAAATASGEDAELDASAMSADGGDVDVDGELEDGLLPRSSRPRSSKQRSGGSRVADQSFNQEDEANGGEDDLDYFDPDLPLEELLKGGVQRRQSLRKSPSKRKKAKPKKKGSTLGTNKAGAGGQGGDLEAPISGTEAEESTGDVETENRRPSSMPRGRRREPEDEPEGPPEGEGDEDEEEDDGEDAEEAFAEQMRLLFVQKPGVLRSTDPNRPLSDVSKLLKPTDSQERRKLLLAQGLALPDKAEIELDGLVAVEDPTVGGRLQRPLFWYEMQAVADGMVVGPEFQIPLVAPPVLDPVPSSSAVTAASVISGTGQGVQSSTAINPLLAEDAGYTLLVDVKDVQFTTSDFLSRQGLIGYQLEALCTEYSNRVDSHVMQFHHDSIEALRSAYSEFRQNAPVPGAAQLTEEERLARMEQLRQDLARGRMERDLEVGQIVQLVRRILALWKELKTLQRQDGFIGTSVRCKFRRVPVEEVDLRREQQDLEDQVEEAVDALSFRTRNSAESAKADRKSLRQEFAQNMFNLRHRNPSDDVIIPVLHSSTISLDSECPAEEVNRRKALAKEHFRVVVYVNEAQAATTREIRLNDQGLADFGEIYVLKVRAYPRSVAVEVVSSKRGPFPKVYLSIPFDGRLNFSAGEIKLKTYWEDETRVPVAKGSETIPNAKDVAEIDPNDPRHSKLFVQLKLAQQQHQQSLVATTASGTAVGSKTGSRSSLSQTQSGSPQILFSITPPTSLIGTGANGVIIDAETLEEDLNERRKREEAEILAQVENDFVREVRRNAEKPLAEVGRALKIQDIVLEPRFPSIGRLMEGIVQFFQVRHRFRPCRRVLDVATSQVTHCSVIVQIGRGTGFPLRRPLYGDSVIGDSGASLSASSAMLSASALGSSAVRAPFGASASSVGGAGAGIGGPGSKGRVQANTARNRRLQQQQQLSGGGAAAHRNAIVEEDPAMVIEEMEDEPMTMLHPFAEVTFQGQRVRTAASSGTRPLFNECLKLDFKPPHNNFTPDVLRMVRDELFINVFDEVTSELVKDDRDTNLFYERRDRRWLGSLKIPFSTIYTNRKVEGTFRLDVPPVNLGYQSEADMEEDLMLSLYITLDPPLELFEEDDQQPPSVEESGVQQQALRWTRALAAKFPSRKFECFATDVRGRSVLTCRYIRPQAPPREVRDSLSKVVRFVSCIPFLEDAMSFGDRNDIWSTSAQFLKMRAGDWEEHAVLLCNYFLYMKKKAYVVLGKGIPEGDTAYVMTVDEGPTGEKQYSFWNAARGEAYPQDDAFIPLRSVLTVFDSENIYANIQSSDFPGSMSFNLEDTKKWSPFFGHVFPRPPNLDSVQIADLPYEPTPVMFRDQLEAELSALLMRCIEKWRGTSRGITKWHRHASKRLSALLEAFEKDRQGIPFSESDHLAAISGITAGYEMFGFPVNVPWIDKDSVIDAVYNTDIHSTGDKEVEFALGVYVSTLPHKVASVWVYLATLSSRQ